MVVRSSPAAMLRRWFEPRARPHPWAVLLLSLLAARYLLWRLGSSLNLATPLSSGLSVLLLAAELLLLLETFLELWISLRPAPPALPLLSAEAAAALGVDLLVPTYGEPLPVVERCLRGCLAIDHPTTTVWLLDDAGRPELEQLATSLGCRYLARPDRLHAKAGNLNHALPFCHQPLIAVFDADVVPLRSFLRRTLPPFADPRLGLLQTPQHYMNADPILRNLRLERWLIPDEEPFYRWIQSSRERFGASICVGTSFVVRRRVLEQVGGFETATPSEDLATGIRIAAAGHRIAYLNEKLSAGLAPLTVAAMVRQRCRWASGSLQTLRTGASPFRIAGLKPMQRLVFLLGILHWFNCLALLLLLLTPALVILLGVPPLRVEGEALVLMAGPFWFSQLLLARWLSGQSSTAVLPELYRLILMVPMAATVISTLLGRPQPFLVTPKGLAPGETPAPQLRLIVPLLLLLAVQVSAVVHLLSGPMTGVAATAGPASRTLLLVWILMNSLLLLIALRCCQERPRLSPVPWFRLQLPAVLSLAGGSLPVRISALSEQGVELELTGPGSDTPPAPGTEGWLSLPSQVAGGSGQAAPPLRLPCRIAVGSARRLGASWGPLTTKQRQQLDFFLYQRDGLWPVRRAPLETMAFAMLFWHLLRPVLPEGWFRRSLVPQAPPGSC
jgi:cellulose synthase (UDP-forming)